MLAASRGIGFACALGLAREGCDLVIASRDPQRIGQAARQIRDRTGARVTAATADVRREEHIRRLVQTAAETYGGVEIAIHNAGGPPAGPFEETGAEEWRQALDANLMSLVWLAQAAAPEMRKAGYGRLIAIASSSIKQPIPNLVLSNVTRAGVWGLAKTLSKELGRDGILVNVIAPGRIRTGRLQELDRATAERSGRTLEEVQRTSQAAIPLGRPGEPEELANVVVFLASQAASYVSGTAIPVDGGRIDTL